MSTKRLSFPKRLEMFQAGSTTLCQTPLSRLLNRSWTLTASISTVERRITWTIRLPRTHRYSIHQTVSSRWTTTTTSCPTAVIWTQFTSRNSNRYSTTIILLFHYLPWHPSKKMDTPHHQWECLISSILQIYPTISKIFSHQNTTVPIVHFDSLISKVIYKSIYL